MRRKDDVERKTISAHVDLKLVKYLEDNRLSKSEWVERGLRSILEQTMTQEELALKLKRERQEEEEKIEKSKRKLEEIDDKAKQTFGTTLEDYLHKHKPVMKIDEQVDHFNDGWLRSYCENNMSREPRHIAIDVYDKILEIEFGLRGNAAVKFVKQCLDELEVIK